MFIKMFIVGTHKCVMCYIYGISTLLFKKLNIFKQILIFGVIIMP